MKLLSTFLITFQYIFSYFGFFTHSLPILSKTNNPPLIDVPTYSLATKNINGDTGMNILTYATPISIKPDRIWALGLFKGTVAHENFARTGEGVLQLLSPEHAKLVKLLGGSSGRDVDKRQECSELGMSWISLNDNDDGGGDGNLPLVLPSCCHYLKIRKIGDMMDYGSHEVAICKVESMFIPKDDNDDEGKQEREHLKTAQLRALGIITAQGRVAG